LLEILSDFIYDSVEHRASTRTPKCYELRPHAERSRCLKEFFPQIFKIKGLKIISFM